jgi:hypothetical protein
VFFFLKYSFTARHGTARIVVTAVPKARFPTLSKILYKKWIGPQIELMAADQTDSLVFKKTVHQFLDIKNSASLSSFDDIRSWTDTLLESVEDGGYEVVLIDNLQYLTQNASHLQDRVLYAVRDICLKKHSRITFSIT